ncbi:MAG TPA: DUF4333 domain-containing protein [Solirubrobacterales bacterium]|nr:DUF4333 domain-containing protein [Solirubrobacterales bacterium]
MSPVPRGKKRFLALCIALLALAAATLVVVGCGDTVIDDTKIEDTIKADVEKSRDEKVSSVECPEPEVDPGSTFTCAIEYPDGKQATITLKIRNEDADLDVVGFKLND